MPNWVYNSLTVEGKPELVTQLKEQMNKSFSQDIEPNGDLSFGIKKSEYTNPIFAFWNIIAPTDLEAYRKQPVSSDLPPSDPNWWADLTEKGLKDNSWYNWNMRNWGVKWDVAVSDEDKYPNTNMEEATNGENLVLVYNFETAWGIPYNALSNLSSQYPTLLFTLSYEEETGWGGEMEFLRGEKTYDTDYNWQCKECDYTEKDEPPYCEECEFDMCPSCGYGEPTDEDRANCQTHKIQLEDTPTEEN